MTYHEIEKLCQGKQLPLCAKNEHNENVLIAGGSEKWSYGSDSWERKFYHLETSQKNGWIRHNVVFDDGSSEEFYSK